MGRNERSDLLIPERFILLGVPEIVTPISSLFYLS